MNMLAIMFAALAVVVFVVLPALVGYFSSRRSTPWLIAAAFTLGVLSRLLFNGNIHTDPLPLLLLPVSFALGAGAMLRLVIGNRFKGVRGA